MQLEITECIEKGKARDVSTSPEVKQNLQLIPLETESKLFRALPLAPKVIGAVTQLIGGPVIKILDQLFTKPARSGMGTSWHTDNAYFSLKDPMAGVAMWIAVDDATEENGALRIVPKVFRHSFAHESDPKSDHHIRTAVQEDDAVVCTMSAGSVAFFCFGTPHATGDNSTDQARTGVGVHFVNRGRMAGLESRKWQRVVLSGEKFSQGRLEYGSKVDFTREVKQRIHDGL